MKSYKTVMIFLGFLLLFSLMSCHMKKRSLGSYNKIVIIADSLLTAEIKEDLNSALERITYTPQSEPIFNLIYQVPSELNRLTRFPNLLIVGTLDAEGEMKNLLQKLLSPTSLQRIKEDSAFVFSNKEPWAFDQILVVLAAKDKETLIKNLQKQGNAIFDLFDQNAESSVFGTLFTYMEQKAISEDLMKKYGWSIRVQHDYFVALDSTDLRFVWLRRLEPQRSIFIYWEPSNDPSLLSKEWMLDRRKMFEQKFLDGDFVYEDSLITTREKIVDFNNRYAIRLDGVWQNEKHTMGGPFRSYGFYNERDKRLYLIDFFVYAPGEQKYPYLRQLDGIASTFKTQGE
ncbi:MAG: DUF4837 family protein [Calditrichaeota bacterium]|nr:MAG: DUF4837 family protein [Calditrichota bacterium]